MINYTCGCGKRYHFAAEFVQAGGSVQANEMGYDLTFTCSCGEAICEGDLWETNPEYRDPLYKESLRQAVATAGLE